ncbi:MAG: helix-turn-helix domain-containing protein [Leptolyngbyaceae cyanobacterium SM2_5_2]|nr:helix-turn-helix domain-containing protein [Leptolyngbyaceae cyanobacterium SM2_5_2]
MLKPVDYPPNILHRSFSDVDDLAGVLSTRRNLQMAQLDLRPLQCDLLLLNIGVGEFSFLCSNCALSARGPKARGFIDFAFVLQAGTQELTAHKVTVSSSTLFGFDNLRENDVILPAHLTLGVLQIKQSVFEEYLQVMGRSDVDSRFLATNYLCCPSTFDPVLTYLRQLYALVKNKAKFLSHPHVSRLILEDFLPLLVDAIPLRRYAEMVTDQPITQAQLVQQAEAYMLAHLNQPITLKNLCESLHTSNRPLYYGFQAVFGVSPMAYLKLLRLHAVRKALMTADPATATVENIANQFGFWSAGHFGQDYKRTFGERPSETLKRSQDERPGAGEVARN